MEMHLRLLENLNIEKFWRCIYGIFYKTTSASMAPMHTYKHTKNGLIIVFNQQTCFTLCLNYHSCNFYSFLTLIINFKSFTQKLNLFKTSKNLQFFTLLQCWMMFLMLIEDPLSLVVWFVTWWWEKNWVWRGFEKYHKWGRRRVLAWFKLQTFSKMHLQNILTFTKILVRLEMHLRNLKVFKYFHVVLK